METAEAVFEGLRMERERLWCWSAATAPHSSCLSQSSIAPSTGVAMATPAFPLTPCEQSDRISPEKELKCQHGSRLCHVGLRDNKGVCFSAQLIVQLYHRIINLYAHYSLLDKLILCEDD